MTYDGVGNLLTLTHELKRTTTYRYDALNRQISVTDALGQTTFFSYDSEGNRVAVIDYAQLLYKSVMLGWVEQRNP